MSPRTHRYVRVAAAVFVLLGGSVHLQQWLRIFHDLSIGPSFLVNVALSLLIGIALLAFDDKWSAVAALLLSIGTLATLIASRTVGLPGFSATGFETPEIEAIVFESLATVLLVIWLVASPEPTAAEPTAAKSTAGRSTAGTDPAADAQNASTVAHPESPAAS